MYNYSKGLNFKICLRAQKATGPFEPEMLTGHSRNGTLHGRSLQLSVAQSLTKGGGGGLVETEQWSAWMVFFL